MVVIKKSSSKGFTLIELMLATSLLMMVLFSGYYGYSLYSQKWQNRVELYWQSTNNGVALDTISQLFSAAVPYIIVNDDAQREVYFSGDKYFVEFVTASPIFTSGYALIRLEQVQVEERTVLKYFERPLHSFTLINKKQLAQSFDNLWKSQTTLISDVQDVAFSFWGWEAYNDAITYMNLEEDIVRTRVAPTWYQQHDSEKVRVLPKQVSIKVVRKDKLSQFTVSLPEHTEYRLLSNARKDGE